MNSEVLKLIQIQIGLLDKDIDLIPWASPIPSFGNIYNAEIATLGLNPSNKEFVDNHNSELAGANRRFHTLNSLSMKSWNESQLIHADLIWDSCQNYFIQNPYNNWFKKLDYILSNSESSYYFPYSNSCHLDLIPFATNTKWGNLDISQQKILLETSGEILANLLNLSNIKLLILNGKSVVDNLQKLANLKFESELMEKWVLPRKSGKGVKGYSYVGVIRSIGEIQLNREINIIGYNHNLQSSYGVTQSIYESIREWIANNIKNKHK